MEVLLYSLFFNDVIVGIEITFVICHVIFTAVCDLNTLLAVKISISKSKYFLSYLSLEIILFFILRFEIHYSLAIRYFDYILSNWVYSFFSGVGEGNERTTMKEIINYLQELIHLLFLFGIYLDN